jgi:hypothetical protein
VFSVNVLRIAIGVGLLAWGLVLLFAFRWQASDAGRLRRIYERNWWLDKRLGRPLRRQQLSKQERLDLCVQRHRHLLKWVGAPAIVLWFSACAWMIAQGIRG